VLWTVVLACCRPWPGLLHRRAMRRCGDPSHQPYLTQSICR
jgi:hypothetical protein